ncbi:hypothetical protein A0H76_2811 [Hepatospora eriocheir]|uniref:Uncharacterized protein n=1 Tax=Hepatospora eriocheir TaxID=1081669 RepID=A0A1X0QER7_9MICR|nr:hypothetical protein A0H76_2811 [Hepatospora eriocheir]
MIENEIEINEDILKLYENINLKNIEGLKIIEKIKNLKNNLKNNLINLYEYWHALNRGLVIYEVFKQLTNAFFLRNLMIRYYFDDQQIEYIKWKKIEEFNKLLKFNQYFHIIDEIKILIFSDNIDLDIMFKRKFEIYYYLLCKYYCYLKTQSELDCEEIGINIVAFTEIVYDELDNLRILLGLL